MKNLIRSERAERINKFIKKSGVITTPHHLTGRRVTTLFELYLGYLRAEDPEWPNSKITFADVFQDAKGRRLMHMYVHGPVSKMADDIYQKLLAQDYEAATKAVLKLRSDEAGNEIKSQIQSHNSSYKHKKKAYERLLDDIFKAKPDIGHKEMERELRHRIGKGIIHHFDDSLGEIVLEDERVFQIKGLKDQIYKRRKIL